MSPDDAVSDDLWCKIYVDADIAPRRLVEIVADDLDGSAEGNSVHLAASEIHLSRNDGFDEMRRRESPDGFLYFRYYLDVEASQSQTREGMIALVSDLLEHLWSRGFQAVAACDFEHELPRNGGYRWRSETPQRAS